MGESLRLSGLGWLPFPISALAEPCHCPHTEAVPFCSSSKGGAPVQAGGAKGKQVGPPQVRSPGPSWGPGRERQELPGLGQVASSF